MGYHIIDMTSDPRCGQFAYFRQMAYPFAGITAEIDITDFMARRGQRPFFLSFLYAVTRAANAVPQLRRRILEDGTVAEFDWCPPSYTAMKPDGAYVYVDVDGGITVTAHARGKMIDSTEGAGGDGPFTPTRLGSIPVMEVLTYLESGHTTGEVKTMLSRSGGFVSHFGTSNSDTVHALVEQGDPKAVTLWNTMIYQLCKSIGAMAAVLEGRVDGILLTGGLVRFRDIVAGVEQRCGWIAPVTVYPGECEQEAMAESVLAVLRGEQAARRYTGRPVFQGFGWE